MLQPLALINENHWKTILTGLPKAIFHGGGGAVPHNLVADHCMTQHLMWELNKNSLQHCTILEHFRNKKKEYHFKVAAQR